MFRYYDKSQWSNSVLVHVLASAVLWLPITALFVAVAIKSGQMQMYLLGFSTSLIFALFLFHRAQTSIVFPAVEVCDLHMVLNTPVGKRAVYDLEYVEGAKFFMHILYFRHKGWPVLTPLPRMPAEARKQLLRAIEDR